MSTPFLNELGRDYAHETLHGSVFQWENKVYTVDEIPENRNAFTATDLETGATRQFDNSIITGWKMFKYPKLGYRSFSPHYAVWVYRRMSYQRGLNQNNMQMSITPFSRTLMNADRGDFSFGISQREKLRMVVMPTFHSKEDFKRLFTGELPHLVLNEDVLIELPTGDTDDDVVDVYYKEGFVGSLTSSLEVKRPTNTKLIERIVNRYVA